MHGQSTVGHLTGDYSKCFDHEPTSFVWQNGVDNPEAAVKLQEIFDKRVNDFKETIIKRTTNINESFYKEQLIYHDKTVNFPISQEISLLFSDTMRDCYLS